MQSLPNYSPFRRTFIAATLSLVLAAPLFAHGDGEEHEKSPLHVAMATMGGALRKLRRQVEDPARVDSSKELLAKMKAAATKAREQEPPSEEPMSEAARAQWTADFHKRLDGVIATIEAAEKALAESKFDVAGQKIAGLSREREAGHEAFHVEED